MIKDTKLQKTNIKKHVNRYNYYKRNKTNNWIDWNAIKYIRVICTTDTMWTVYLACNGKKWVKGKNRHANITGTKEKACIILIIIFNKLLIFIFNILQPYDFLILDQHHKSSSIILYFD